VAYERRVVEGVEMMQVDFGTAAEQRGLDPRSPHIRFAGGLHGGRGLGRAGPTAGDPAGDHIRRITPRGLQVLREV
jgi:hypothetical protein